MTELNDRAAEALRGFEPSAVTDVTGFGLFGHAHEMAERSGVRIELDADALPGLPGALRRRGGRPAPAAMRPQPRLRRPRSRADGTPDDVVALGYDPQTAGGLLVSPAGRERRCSGPLRRRGALPARIGRVVEGSGWRSPDGGRRPVGTAPLAHGLALGVRVVRYTPRSRPSSSSSSPARPSASTGSGLGCENWPSCGETFLPPKDYNAYVEFGNRVAGFVVGLTTLARRSPPSVSRACRAGSLERRRAAVHGARPGSARRRHRPARAAPADRHGPLPPLLVALAVAVVVVQGARDLARGGPRRSRSAPPGSRSRSSRCRRARRLRDARHLVRIHIGATALFGVAFLALLGLLIGSDAGRGSSWAWRPSSSASCSRRWSSARSSGGGRSLGPRAPHVTLATAVWVAVVALAARSCSGAARLP